MRCRLRRSQRTTHNHSPAAPLVHIQGTAVEHPTVKQTPAAPRPGAIQRARLGPRATDPRTGGLPASRPDANQGRHHDATGRTRPRRTARSRAPPTPDAAGSPRATPLRREPRTRRASPEPPPPAAAREPRRREDLRARSGVPRRQEPGEEGRNPAAADPSGLCPTSSLGGGEGEGRRGGKTGGGTI